MISATTITMGIVQMESARPSTALSPRLVVTGTARCGSSLTMQMLAAVGVPVTGTNPAHEDDAGLAPRLLEQPRYAGRAVKVLDANRHAMALPQGLPIVWIWARRRRRREQAKSHRKFVALFGYDMPWSAVPKLEASLAASDAELARLLSNRGEPSLEMWFEDVLEQPVLEALRLVNFIKTTMLGFEQLPTSAVMAAAGRVVKRSAECLPGFLEIDMTRSAMGARRVAS